MIESFQIKGQNKPKKEWASMGTMFCLLLVVFAVAGSVIMTVWAFSLFKKSELDQKPLEGLDGTKINTKSLVELGNGLIDKVAKGIKQFENRTKSEKQDKSSSGIARKLDGGEGDFFGRVLNIFANVTGEVVKSIKKSEAKKGQEDNNNKTDGNAVSNSNGQKDSEKTVGSGIATEKALTSATVRRFKRGINGNGPASLLCHGATQDGKPNDGNIDLPNPFHYMDQVGGMPSRTGFKGVEKPNGVGLHSELIHILSYITPKGTNFPVNKQRWSSILRNNLAYSKDFSGFSDRNSRDVLTRYPLNPLIAGPRHDQIGSIKPRRIWNLSGLDQVTGTAVRMESKNFYGSTSTKKMLKSLFYVTQVSKPLAMNYIYTGHENTYFGGKRASRGSLMSKQHMKMFKTTDVYPI